VPSAAWSIVGGRTAGAARCFLAAFLGSDGALTDPKEDRSAHFRMACRTGLVHWEVRISRHFAPWLDRQQRERSRVEAHAASEVKDGSASFELVCCPLLPYQREGVLHLPLASVHCWQTKWAIQAIAPCELLARRRDMGRLAWFWHAPVF
jgi:hypothetical protein